MNVSGRLKERMAEPPSSGAYLVLLGTRAGPHPSMRAATVTALVVDGSIYLVDAGAGLIQRFYEAGLEFAKLKAMFITHMHSDHIADYFMFFNVNFPYWKMDSQQIRVFGPGRADLSGPATSPTPGMPYLSDTPLISPNMPTPGIVEMTDLLADAYAYDLNNSIRTTRRTDGHPRDFMGHTNNKPMILPEALRTPLGANVDNPSPDMEPVVIYEDEKVRVSSILVHHPPVFPAFGFRFETAYGDIVVSGDTTPCANLSRLANDADVLVNEVIAIDEAIGMYAGTALEETYRQQFLTGHTPLVSHGVEGEDGFVPGVGRMARDAGVGTLVLTHMYPGDEIMSPEAFKAGAESEFEADVIVGDDLMMIDISKLRKASKPALTSLKS